MSIPTDTLFAQQWFLQNTVVGEYDLDVVTAWDEFTGKGVKVFVIDDGFEHDHPDLAPNYDITLDKDYGSDPDDDDAAPVFTTGGRDNHGTSVMGIIGAARNETGVVGVAYDATLIGVRITYDVTADVWRTNYVTAFDDAVTDGAGVINMSFGGAADFDKYDGAANVVLVHAAMEHAVSDGRDGLGIALVKSAGNSRGSDIDVNHNQSDNDTRQIIVAAVNRDGFVSEYSSYGAAILVSGFGSPLSGQIVTTDRLDANGYETGDFMTTFNGTSAAAPMVSGVVSLMLQANDQLGWRDIQAILASTARHVGSVIDGATTSGSELNPWNWNDATTWNGGGMHYSEDYGYGLVDALAAVRLAESWTRQSTTINQQTASLVLLDADALIPDNDLTGTPFTGDMTGNIVIERVTVTLEFSADNAADLEVYLTGPDGREEKLIADQGQGYSYDDSYTLHTQAFRGELSSGAWTVRVVDDAAGNALDVSNITINAYGSSSAKNDTYIYTNEFSDFTDTHSTHLKDKDGGSDTLNAAAVTDGMIVNLSKGSGKIDGVDVTVSGIDNVFGGDGNDRLVGSAGVNDLAGGRGEDVMAGGKGGDVFIFRVVTDSLSALRDVISDFGKGNDRIDLSDIDTGAADGDQKFKFIGDHGFHGKAAELNFDLVNKAGTKHDLTLVSGDLDGDKSADFQIELTGLHKLVSGDFFL